MSFLNSVLSSIGGDGPKVHTPPPQTFRPPDKDVSQASNRKPGNISTPTTTTCQGTKRKAEDYLVATHGKVTKSGVADGRSSRPTSTSESRASRAIMPSKSTLPTPSNIAMPYRGTSKPSPATNGPQTSTTLAIDTSKAPKKGSYAEIMARAKATQSKSPAVGVISHKPKEKMSYKKELKLKKKALKNKKLGIKEEARPSSSGSMSSSPAPVNSDAKKGQQPGYKGTAKPKPKPKPQPSYKGTMKSATSGDQNPISRDRASQASKIRYDEYAATDEDDLDDIEEDDDGSEESDDMEAGFSDVEQEESTAAKAARKEDEEEAKLEARLKNEKEERKRRLEAMAKKAKPQRY